MYTCRDATLRKSKNRAKFIDYYYYASSVTASSVDLTFALAVKDVWDTNILRRFANLSATSYADTVLIGSVEKTKLLNLCDVVAGYSTDARYEAIVDTVRAYVNRFYNKTNSYVDSNF
jgi:hypothetical protein